MQPRPVRRTGIWLFVALSYLVSAAFVAWRFVGPSDGAPIPFYSDAWTTVGVHANPVQPTSVGLQPGDLVLAVNGRSVSDWLADSINPFVARAPSQIGTTLVYTVDRQGTRTDVPVTLARQDLSASLAENWANLLFGAVLLAVALYVLRRRPDLSAAAALAIAATGAGASITPWLLGFTVSDIYFGTPFVLQTVSVTAIYMLLWPSGALHLPIALAPAHSGLPGPSRRLLAGIYGTVLGVYALALVLALLASATLTAWLGTWGTLQALVIIPTVSVGLVLAVAAYRRTPPENQRQLRWALVGGCSRPLSESRFYSCHRSCWVGPSCRGPSLGC